MRSRLISARYAGRCRTCGKSVHAGQPVWFAKNFGVRCQACGPHTAGDEPTTKSKYRGHGPARRQEPTHRSPYFEPTGCRPATHGSDGVHRYEFASITAAVRDALCDDAQNDFNRELIRRRHSLHGLDRRGDSWTNRFNRERLLSELSNPSSKLLDAVDEMRQRLIGDLNLPVTPRRKVRRGLDDGDELDADGWLARDPYAWERSVREPRTRQTVTIGCNLAVNAHHQPDQLLYRGAAALALADVLTERGLNVRIVAFFATYSPSRTVDRSVVSYEVKAADMPLDLSAVAFCLCEIAFARVIAVLGGARHWPGQLRSGLGSADRLPAGDRDGIDYLIDADCLSREAAEMWLRSQLESEACNV